MIFLVPESPRWLIMHRRHEEAITVLKRIRNTDNVQAEIDEISANSTDQMNALEIFRTLFAKSMRPALILGISLQFFQQTCGINTAMYYRYIIYHIQLLDIVLC